MSRTAGGGRRRKFRVKKNGRRARHRNPTRYAAAIGRRRSRRVRGR